MKIYNNNPAFGDCGPFDCESDDFDLECRRLADEMAFAFSEWARDEFEQLIENTDPEDLPEENEDEYLHEAIAKMRAEFIHGLTEVQP